MEALPEILTAGSLCCITVFYFALRKEVLLNVKPIKVFK